MYQFVQYSGGGKSYLIYVIKKVGSISSEAQRECLYYFQLISRQISLLAMENICYPVVNFIK